MGAAPLPDDELDRLKAIVDLQIDATERDPRLETIVRLAAEILEMPTSLVSIVDNEQQRFKAKVGLDVDATPRDYAFCGWAILDRCPFIVEDAAADRRFSDNPLVNGPPHIRFYGGAPMVTRTGRAIGTLCVIDSKTRHLSDRQVSVLQLLASLAVDTIEAKSLEPAGYDGLRSLNAAATDHELVLDSISHEMKTPLSHVIGFADLLLSDRDADPLSTRQREYLEYIRAGGEHASDLLTNYLAAAKAGSAAPNTLRVVSVGREIGRIVATFRQAIAARGQSIVFDGEDREITAMLNVTSLREVITNLITNASKYGPVGTKIAVELGPENQIGIVSITVRDDGPGIPASVMAAVGTPYNRGNSGNGGAPTGADAPTGTGLGLYLCMKLVSDMGGSMSIEPANPGGTCVRLTIPAEPRRN